MAGKRVVLHIGTMKSGTTFLQSVLGNNLAALDEAGVHAIAGSATKHRGRPHHASKKLQHTATGEAPWRQILDAIEGTSAETVVISSEFFSFLRPPGIETVRSTLADHDVSVLLTVRDQLSAIPAQWQSFTRNRGRTAFGVYVKQITDPERSGTASYRSFHRAQDVAGIVERWTRVAEPVLVTVPPSGSPPDLMWHRFCEAAGIAPIEPALDDVADNQSLGYPSCDCLRRLNRHLTSLSQNGYRKAMRPVAREVLTPLRAGQARPQIDRATAAGALERNLAMRALIDSGRVGLVGAATDLPVDVDIDRMPETIVPPDHAQVVESAQVVHRYAAERAGVADEPPEKLPALIQETATLLIRAEGSAGD